MSSKDVIQPYGPVRKLADGLHCVDGGWKKTPFGRRMTILKLRSGGLVIHNPIRMREEDYAGLEALGPVQVIVAPNKFHSSDAHVYKLRYPKAKLYVSSAAREAVAARCAIDGTLPQDWTPELRSEIDCLEFEGTRMLSETAFLHRASRTLVITDLAFNMRTDVKGAQKLFFRFNLIYKRFGPSRIFKHVFLKDKSAAAASLGRLLQWDFDRVIVNHGDVVESGGKEGLRKGFAEIGVS